MLYLRLADVTVGIDHRHPFLSTYCGEYVVPPTDAPDFILSVTDEDSERERGEDGARWSLAYLETLAVYRKIAEGLAELGGMLVHGVLMEVDGRGILLLAKSGVGKSTHSRYWQQLLGQQRCRIINGDKPLVRKLDGNFYGYGTPWNGKEGLSENRRVPLTDIAFITRGAQDAVRPLGAAEALPRMVGQVHFPAAPAHRIAVFDRMAELLSHVRCHEFVCTNSLGAAEAAYRALFS